jgi:hypothetical protein
MKFNQTKITVNLITCLLGMLVLFAANTQAQSTGVTPCEAKITSLKQGDKVGPSATVRGTANVPLDGYLWLFARKTSMGNQWWPQAGGAVNPDDTTSEWEAEVFFGIPADIQSNFDVVAVVVNQQTDRDLTKWFSTAHQTRQPVRFPDAISGCPIVRVRVTKIE